MERRAFDLVVTGHVQGVFYRATMRDQAQRLGVVGWARNHPDGSVRAHVEGTGEALAELLHWCADGPPAARVDEVRRREAEPESPDDFDIR
jgi:acylphosphatase